MNSKREVSLRPGLAAILLAGVGLAGVGGGAALASADFDQSGAFAAPQAAAVASAGAHASLADMVQAVGPSVVQIRIDPRTAQFGDQSPQLSQREEMMRRFFGFQGHEQRQPPPQSSLGSGFIIDDSGIVLTNNHVVASADRVTVQLSDGRELNGRVLGRDDKTDVAVVKIEGGGNFKAVAWGDSGAARVGDSVFAVGSPFGLGNTVTAGIISARSREIGAGPYDDFLQVDAAINSGNSGGPLFDASGRVIGVNTAIFSPSGGNVGIGFAIPAQLARDIAMQIVEHGGVERGRIGVALQDFTGEMAAALGVEADGGALINEVDPSGPAARSGIRPGDVIQRFAGKAIEDGGDLARAVAEAEAGKIVPIEILRDGRRLAIELGIGSGETAHS